MARIETPEWSQQPEPDEPDDDAALSWEGDEQLGRATSLTDPARVRSDTRDLDAPDDAAVLGATATELSAVDRPAGSIGARLLVALFGVLYLVWTVGWILAVQSLGGILGPSTGTVWLDFVARIGQFLALIAAALWFAAVLQLTRDAAPRLRFGWLALGLGLLAPWPLLVGWLS